MLITEARLTAVAQRVMRAQAGASGWQAFWGGGLGVPGGGGASGMRRQGGWGSWVARASQPDKYSPPKGAFHNESDALAQTLWHSTRWCHVLVGLGRGTDALHAQVAYGVSAQPALNRTFCDHATQYVVRHGTARQLVGGDFNFDLNYPLRAPPSVLASLLTRRLADADLEPRTALGRDPLCSYHGGTRRTWWPYRRRKADGSASGSDAYLRLMGRQASFRRPSISARLALAVPSGLLRKVTGRA